MNKIKPINILLLYDHEFRIAATVKDHLDALKTLTRHNCFSVSMLGSIPKRIDLNRFDALIIHYTLMACHEDYLTKESRERIRKFKGMKIMFIQDEYRNVNETIQVIQYMNINLLFTCYPESEIEKVYSDKALPTVKKVNVLTGYVPERLKNYGNLSPSQRKLIVGYRGRKVQLG